MPVLQCTTTTARHTYSAIATVLALSISGCASVDSTTSLARVPDRLAPDAKESLRMVVPASGVQIYECRAKQDQAGAYEWAFVAPEADLFDTRGNRIGRHYGGPHWDANDGSKIAGVVRERADAPAAAQAIPWLLLAAKSVGAHGAFSQVTSIQRVNTAGGTAPQGGCAQATAGTQARISYTADYYFFGVGPTPRQPRVNAYQKNVTY